MRRRGWSTIMPSMTDCTWLSCVATCWRSDVVVAQGLRLDALNDLLGLLDQGVQLSLERTLRCAKAVKELGQVGDGAVAEDLALAVARGAEPFGQVLDQLGELADEGLLGQLHGFLEARGDAALFLLEDGRVELAEVVGRLDVGKVPLHAEQAAQRRGIIVGVEQIAQALPGGRLEFARSGRRAGPPLARASPGSRSCAG